MFPIQLYEEESTDLLKIQQNENFFLKIYVKEEFEITEEFFDFNEKYAENGKHIKGILWNQTKTSISDAGHKDNDVGHEDNDAGHEDSDAGHKDNDLLVTKTMMRGHEDSDMGYKDNDE
ncbi:hypothetical protein Anas_12429 [Armadillidium nasatum]|uniref:Uncharacterized protein n=1 Tax=Armadillidium nasatum TaxID=96803 RepID=A0A5N5T1J0_9CRUS|nr:hypothetical protein Anas_12429 [Armadillidium nasatum]